MKISETVVPKIIRSYKMTYSGIYIKNLMKKRTQQLSARIEHGYINMAHSGLVDKGEMWLDKHGSLFSSCSQVSKY